MSKALVREVAPLEINVNRIAPGLVDTLKDVTPDMKAQSIQEIPTG